MATPPNEKRITTASVALMHYQLANITRNGWVVEAWKAGISKWEIHKLSGISRPTIDKILEQELDLHTT
jgi:hypothetical protein